MTNMKKDIDTLKSSFPVAIEYSDFTYCITSFAELGKVCKYLFNANYDMNYHHNSIYAPMFEIGSNLNDVFKYKYGYELDKASQILSSTESKDYKDVAENHLYGAKRLLSDWQEWFDVTEYHKEVQMIETDEQIYKLLQWLNVNVDSFRLYDFDKV